MQNLYNKRVPSDQTIASHYSLLQVVLVSATMPKEVLDMSTRFMRDPIRILVKNEEITLEGIRQFYVQTEKEVPYKVQLLHTNRGHFGVEL